MRNNSRKQPTDLFSSAQRISFCALIFVLVVDGLRSAFLEKAKYDANPADNFSNLQRCAALFFTSTSALVFTSYTAARSLFPNRPSNNAYSPLPQNETDGDHFAITMPK